MRDLRVTHVQNLIYGVLLGGRGVSTTLDKYDETMAGEIS